MWTLTISSIPAKQTFDERLTNLRRSHKMSAFFEFFCMFFVRSIPLCTATKSHSIFLEDQDIYFCLRLSLNRFKNGIFIPSNPALFRELVSTYCFFCFCQLSTSHSRSSTWKSSPIALSCNPQTRLPLYLVFALQYIDRFCSQSRTRFYNNYTKIRL